MKHYYRFFLWMEKVFLIPMLFHNQDVTERSHQIFASAFNLPTRQTL